MSANALTLPAARAYNGDDTWIKFASNLIDADPVARITLDISGSGPTVGQTIIIEWAGNTVTFTVASTINATATAWPVKSGLETLAAYALRVAEAIRQNGIITESWRVLTLGTAGSAERLQLEYRNRVALDITVTNTLSNVAETVADGTDPQLEPNLACTVQVWKVLASDDDDDLIGTLQSPYDVISGTTEFNLKNFFELRPSLPATSSINPGLITSWPRGLASDAYLEYYLRYNDKHGTPAVPLALVKTDDNYFMLHGSRAADHDDVDTSGAIQKLHAYRRRDGGVFRKPITELMVDYLYIWTYQEITDANIEFVITWSDGTDTSHPYTGSDFILAANRVYWIKSTPKTFSYTPPSAGAFIEYITFKLVGDGGDGVATLAEVYYTAKVTPDWQVWVLFDNGLGGCETVPMLGKTRRSIAASRDTSRRQRTSDFNIADGELIGVGAESSRVYEMNTGWVERYYIEHLQQLLLGDAWIIDRDNSRFIKLICESTGGVVSSDDNTLFSMDVTFKTAWIDTAINL